MRGLLSSPRPLFQVLEEEYMSLHGPIPEGESSLVELPDGEGGWRSIAAARDYLFREGHIYDPVELAAELLTCEGAQRPEIPPRIIKGMQQYDWARENLKKYVREKIGDETLENIIEWYRSGPHAELASKDVVQPLQDRMNSLLGDPQLCDLDRFALSWLSEETKGLVEVYSPEGGCPHGLLVRTNRLLLEDAFPNAIEKIGNVRLAAMHQRLHASRQTALCLSGGGIRSGTFALGLIQGMARHKLLKSFDYLSTVSGGGYIGSWLTAWLHRHPDGLEGVTRDLANSNPSSKIDPDPPPVRYLREYSNFITPKVGLLTADTWTFIGIYLRNLLLNWLVFIPLIVAALLLPRFILAVTMAQPDDHDAWSLILPGLDVTFRFRHLFLVIGFVLGTLALAYIGFNRPGIRELLKRRSRFWRRRSNQRSFLLWCFLPLFLSAVFLTTYWAWSVEAAEGQKPVLFFLIFGMAFTFFGWLIASLFLRRLFHLEEISILGLVAMLVIGALGGVLVWAMSLFQIGNPIIGYGPLTSTGQTFPWKAWAPWSWLGWTTELYVCFAVPLFLLIVWVTLTFLVGLTSAEWANITSARWKIDDQDREWWARFSAWILIAVIVWSVANVLVMFGPLALLESPRVLAAIGGFSGLFSILLGQSSFLPAGGKNQSKGGLAVNLLGTLLPVAAAIFIGAFVAAVSLATTGITYGVIRLANQPEVSSRINVEYLTNVPLKNGGFREFVNFTEPSAVAQADGMKPSAFTEAKIVHLNVLHHTSWVFVLSLLAVLFLLGMLLSRIINLNIFSLHGGYRNRLIRAFLGASRPSGARKPHPFTGFDPADNIHMHELRPGLLDEDDFLEPEKLAKDLLEPDNAISGFLLERNRLQHVREQSGAGASPKVIAALRTDLNAALETENLYTQGFSNVYLRSGRAARIFEATLRSLDLQSLDDAPLRSDYRILLNRLVLETAYAGKIKQVDFPPPPYKLMHVINTALNLVGGDNLAWQQRKAEPFSVSPLHSGCFRLGYRNSREYGGKHSGGISIGTAAAISGAAASSNMGYYTTSPVLSLVLTLFNVRLGWWLGNPAVAGDKTYILNSPRYSVAPIIYEALGLTDDKSEYVYLTDGGHYENLAIYEMVLRRCRIIVASDGSGDPEYRFNDLGNALRKIRIDLGVPIEFTSVPIYAETPPNGKGGGMYWALGKIRYSCIDHGAEDGVLLYIKPAVYGTEPRDVLEYKRSFPVFPHQSTGDQFFDEPQFESYRMLGSHIVDQLCGEGNEELDLHQLITNAYGRLTAKDGDSPADPSLEKWLGDWLAR